MRNKFELKPAPCGGGKKCEVCNKSYKVKKNTCELTICNKKGATHYENVVSLERK